MNTAREEALPTINRQLPSAKGRTLLICCSAGGLLCLFAFVFCITLGLRSNSLSLDNQSSAVEASAVLSDSKVIEGIQVAEPADQRSTAEGRDATGEPNVVEGKTVTGLDTRPYTAEGQGAVLPEPADQTNTAGGRDATGEPNVVVGNANAGLDTDSYAAEEQVDVAEPEFLQANTDAGVGTQSATQLGSTQDPNAASVEKYTSGTAAERAEQSTCRIQNACISMDLDHFEVLLPDSMSTVPEEVLEGCTNAGITFRAETPPADAKFYNEDLLFGVFPTLRSYSLAHFTLDAGVLIDMFETVLGDRNVSHQTFDYEKYNLRAAGEWSVSSTLEPSLSSRRFDTRPAVLVDPLVRDRGSDKAMWIADFATHVLKTSGRLPTFISPPRDNSKRETHCFRSIWTPPRSFKSSPVRRLANYSIFKEMGVDKVPRNEVCRSAPLKVRLLNRQTTRVITNVDEVKRAAEDALTPQFAELDYKEIFFDGKQFDEQLAEMQDADVLIAAHGAGIANALFLRERSLLLEISPFCYNFGGFQKGSDRAFDIDSSFVVSGPDRKTFTKVIRQWCLKDGSCEAMTGQFRKLEKVADLEKAQKSLRFFNSYESCATLQNNLISNRGLKAQTLHPEPERVYSRLKEWAQMRCQS